MFYFYVFDVHTHSIRCSILRIQCSQSLGDLIIEDEVVGTSLENIDLHFRLESDELGDRVFSDFGTGDLFRSIDDHVRTEEGLDVVPLCLAINMDKTHLSRLSDVEAWPCNVAILNCKTHILSKRCGSRLVGYCPIMSISDRSLAPFLTQAGICKSKQTDAIRLQKKLLEQDFMKSVIDPILRLANAPPILLQYGSQPNSVYRTKLFIVLYICKKTMIRAFNCVYTVIACNVYLVPVLHDLNPLIF